MRKTLGVSLLVLLLSSSASAGLMPNESPAPASSQATNAAQEPTGGVMPNDGPTANGEMPNLPPGSLTQTALDLLALLPSLL